MENPYRSSQTTGGHLNRRDASRLRRFGFGFIGGIGGFFLSMLLAGVLERVFGDDFWFTRSGWFGVLTIVFIGLPSVAYGMHVAERTATSSDAEQDLTENAPPDASD